MPKRQQPSGHQNRQRAQEKKAKSDAVVKKSRKINEMFETASASSSNVTTPATTDVEDEEDESDTAPANRPTDDEMKDIDSPVTHDESEMEIEAVENNDTVENEGEVHDEGVSESERHVVVENET